MFMLYEQKAGCGRGFLLGAFLRAQEGESGLESRVLGGSHYEDNPFGGLPKPHLQHDTILGLRWGPLIFMETAIWRDKHADTPQVGPATRKSSCKPQVKPLAPCYQTYLENHGA